MLYEGESGVSAPVSRLPNDTFYFIIVHLQYRFLNKVDSTGNNPDYMQSDCEATCDSDRLSFPFLGDFSVLPLDISHGHHIFLLQFPFSTFFGVLYQQLVFITQQLISVVLNNY